MSVKTLTAKILLYLYENPGASIKDLSVVFNASLQTIRNTVYRLRNNGFVEKTGSGYILTSKGEWFVTNVLKKERATGEETLSDTESEPEKHGSQSEVAEESVEAGKSTKSEEVGVELGEIIDKITSIEKEIDQLKSVLSRIVREVSNLKKSVEEISKSISKPEEKPSLPKPVMNIREAVSLLGSQLDRLRIEGRVEVIGSLVVDKSFYDNFKKKFPMDINEVSKLSDVEKVLLDEMIKDARVIVHSGRQYRLVD